MIVHQLSVFLVNKTGRLAEVLEALGSENIRITARCITDTSEFGILRTIVSDPFKVREILTEQSFAVSLTETISGMVPNETKFYAKVL